MHILLVDNDNIMLIIQSKILEKTGASVDSVNSGFKAIELLQRKKYDFIVMDCQMPEIDGFETTVKIRAMANQTPIIALTGNDTQQDRQECQQAGMNDFLTKPLKLPDLKAALLRLNIV